MSGDDKPLVCVKSRWDFNMNRWMLARPVVITLGDPPEGRRK